MALSEKGTLLVSAAKAVLDGPEPWKVEHVKKIVEKASLSEAETAEVNEAIREVEADLKFSLYQAELTRMLLGEEVNIQIVADNVSTTGHAAFRKKKEREDAELKRLQSKAMAAMAKGQMQGHVIGYGAGSQLDSSTLKQLYNDWVNQNQSMYEDQRQYLNRAFSQTPSKE
jgi:hypothetical protein